MSIGRLFSLENKIAIITGAGGVLGAAQARVLASAGAKVVVTDLNFVAVRELADSIGPSAHPVQHDVASEAGWNKVVEVTAKRFGRPTILVNCAGIFVPGSIETIDAHALENAFRVNVVGAFLGIQSVLSSMIHAGEGSIINIGSGAGMRGMADLIAYSTSKWALRGLTRSAALDLAKYNVRVNCICPGVVDSPMARARGAMGVSIPIGRTADPEEIAPFVLVLASGSGSYATGTEIVIDGGRSA